MNGKKVPEAFSRADEKGVLGIEIRIPETEVQLDEDGQRIARPSHPTIAKAARLFPEAKAHRSAWTMDLRQQLPICDRVMQSH